jgi:hypothetical protein
MTEQEQDKNKDLGQGIRPYGPGKFSTVLDAYVYQVSLDGGCDAEVGSSTDVGWWGLMRHGHTIFQDHDPFLEPLNEQEQEQLQNCAGCILTEDSQGFVYVEYFDNEKALDAKWAQVEHEHEQGAQDDN